MQSMQELENNNPDDIRYMKEAIRQAKKAAKLKEVPIGCVIVYDGKIIARGYNRRNTDKSTLAHAEIAAIKKASRVIGDWRLEDCTMYVTLEPCQMCSGAIVQARIPRVVIGTMNAKAGCAGSVINILQMEGFNHRVDITLLFIFKQSFMIIFSVKSIYPVRLHCAKIGISLYIEFQNIPAVFLI